MSVPCYISCSVSYSAHLPTGTKPDFYKTQLCCRPCRRVRLACHRTNIFRLASAPPRRRVPCRAYPRARQRSREMLPNRRQTEHKRTPQAFCRCISRSTERYLCSCASTHPQSTRRARRDGQSPKKRAANIHRAGRDISASELRRAEGAEDARIGLYCRFSSAKVRVFGTRFLRRRALKSL